MIRGSISLSGGLQVDYCEIGPPDAPVVLYCHGTPGSRFELLLARPALRRNRARMRLVALNRPGYGTSSFIRHEGFLPWAGIVDEAADRLGLDRFAVLGASGGSPFALACAASLTTRVRRVGIVAGVAPPDTPGMERAAALAQEKANPWLRALRYGSLHLATRMGLSRILTRRLIASLGDADREALRDPDSRTSLEMVVREGFGQWGRAAATEAGCFMRSWDFEPAAVTQEVRLWHGTDDTRIPADVAAAFADRMPGSRVVLWPDHGHFSWATSDEIASVADYLAHPAG